MWVIVTGSPFDGLTVHEGEETAEETVQKAEEHFQGQDYWVVPVNSLP